MEGELPIAKTYQSCCNGYLLENKRLCVTCGDAIFIKDVKSYNACRCDKKNNFQYVTRFPKFA